MNDLTDTLREQLAAAHKERADATAKADRLRSYLRSFCAAVIEDSKEDGTSGLAVILDLAKTNPSMGYCLRWVEHDEAEAVITAGQIGRAIELVGHDGKRLLPAEPAKVDLLAEAVTRLEGVSGRLSTLEHGAAETANRLRIMEHYLQKTLDMWDQLSSRCIESGAVVAEKDLEYAKRARLFLNKGLGTT